MTEFKQLAVHALAKHHLPRIAACMEKLGDEGVWWRPNAASNSAGNLALHLAGNVRQWISSRLGGAPDIRDRDREFSETGPIPSRVLAGLLRKEVDEACRVIQRLTAERLAVEYTIQGIRVTGLSAVEHVVEHFAHHAGQIIYVTKLRSGEDLGFTRLPGRKSGARKRRGLPVI